MALFEKAPHYYDDEPKVREAIYKALPRGMAKRADDDIVVGFLHNLLDFMEDVLCDRMGRDAFLQAFAAIGMNEPLPSEVRSRLTRIGVGNADPSELDTREFYQFRWKATGTVLYHHCRTFDRANALFGEIWQSFIQNDLSVPQSNRSIAAVSPLGSRESYAVEPQGRSREQQRNTGGETMPDLTSFLRVEMPQMLSQYEASSGTLSPPVRQQMLKDMENRFREIY